MAKKATPGPRRAQPATLRPPIEKVPFFGTTWYRRGPAYWFRRFLMSLLMAIGLAVAVAIMWGLVGAIVNDSGLSLAGKVGILAVIAVASGHSLFRAGSAFVTVERRRRAGQFLHQPNPPAVRRRRRAGSAGATTGTAANAGSLVSGALLLAGVIGYLGWIIVMFLWTLQPEFGVEHDARLRLDQWTQAHGNTA